MATPQVTGFDIPVQPLTELSIPVWDDATTRPGLQRGRRFIEVLQRIGITVQGRNVADLGTGFGSIAIAAAMAGARSVLAVDADRTRVDAVADRSKAAGVHVDARVVNLIAPPDDLPKVDVALMIGVIEYAGLWDLDATVEELQLKVLGSTYDILVPGGILVLGSKNRLWPSFALRDVHTKQPLVNVLPRSLADHLSRWTSGNEYRHHVHAPSIWCNLLRHAGFQSMTVYYPYFSYQYPLKLVRKPKLGDIGELIPAEHGEKADPHAYGRLWRLKVLGMAVASKLGIPLSQSLIIVAQR